MQIETSIKKPELVLAATYLNISAILSALSKHHDALKFAKKANFIYLKHKEDYMSTDQAPGQDPEASLGQQAGQGDTDLGTTLPALPNGALTAGSRDPFTIKTNFIISFINMATELQYIGRRTEASQVYHQGYEFSVMELGPQHHCTLMLQQINSKLDRDTTMRSTFNSSQNKSHEKARSLSFNTSRGKKPWLDNSPTAGGAEGPSTNLASLLGHTSRKNSSFTCNKTLK